MIHTILHRNHKKHILGWFVGNRPPLSIYRCSARHGADLAVYVISFISWSMDHSVMGRHLYGRTLK